MRVNSPLEPIPAELTPLPMRKQNPALEFIAMFAKYYRAERKLPFYAHGEDWRHAKFLMLAYGEDRELLEEMVRCFFRMGMFSSRGVSGSVLRAFWTYRNELEFNAREALREAAEREAMSAREKQQYREELRSARVRASKPPLRVDQLRIENK